MLNALYKKDWKAHWKLLLVIFGVLAMYLAVIIGMYDPAGGDALEQLVALKMPEELLAAFGFTNQDASLLGFLASYLYGFLMLALPMVTTLIVANRLVAVMVDRGAMASLLSSAVTRRQVVFTQAVFLISLVAAQVLFTTGAGILLCEISFPGQLDQAGFIRLNGGLFMVHLALSGVSFFFSCLFNESRLSLAFCAGIPVMFLVMQMLFNYNEKLSLLRWLSLFSLYNPNDFVSGNPVLVPMLALGGVAAVLYVAGTLVFDRKDLPL